VALELDPVPAISFVGEEEDTAARASWWCRSGGGEDGGGVAARSSGASRRWQRPHSEIGFRVCRWEE
jgi:hypothetical protein